MSKPDIARILHAKFFISLPKWKQTDERRVPQICFAGRSNVGKSSLINALVGQSTLAKTSSTPGRTQSIVAFDGTFRRAEKLIPFQLIDLPGYGYAKVPMEIKKGWKPMTESYFRGNKELVCCVMLLDIRRDPKAEELELLEMAEEISVPIIPVITKVDKVSKTLRAKEFKRIATTLNVDVEDLRRVSLPEKMGIQDLAEELFDLLSDRQVAADVAIPNSPEL